MVRWILSICFLSVGAGCSSGQLFPEKNLKVAFVGDISLYVQSVANTTAVLDLIKAEKAQALILLGDIDYTDQAPVMEALINERLGEEFPLLVSFGNHDLKDIPRWQTILVNRLKKTPALDCVGNIGIKAVCTFKGIVVVHSTVALLDTDHEEFIDTALKENQAIWKICAWHEVQRLMQVGGKQDSVGWGVYETCRKNGAIIATAHQHMYSRTHLMSDFENQTIASTENEFTIKPGETFAFVSGLGGVNIRSEKDGLGSNPWWASLYSADRNANYGALFCTFHVDNNPRKARCYFKDIAGKMVDEFTLMSGL